MAFEIEGLTGGGLVDGNGRKKRQNQKPEYTTFKYSTRFAGPLHEAIMLGSEPFFLTFSETKGTFDLVRKIEEVNRVLVPPYPEEYPYDPIEFSSREELQEYFDLARNETIDSLCQGHHSRVVKRTFMVYGRQ